MKSSFCGYKKEKAYYSRSTRMAGKRNNEKKKEREKKAQIAQNFERVPKEIIYSSAVTG